MITLTSMNNIIFVTGNHRKIGEARSSCSLFDLTVEQHIVDIDEIQSHDPLKIAEHKATQAFQSLALPLVVNDAFWSIPSLGGFPGGYMKDIAEWFDPKDFLALMKDKKDRSVMITECIVYKDHETTKMFTKVFKGTIGEQIKGDGNSIERVAVFNGRTLAEHHDLGQFSEKPEDQLWYDFAYWYTDYLA